LLFKEEDQDYARVVKLLGGLNVQVKDTSGNIKIAHIRGAFRKRVWLSAGDLVLISGRGTSDGKSDIIHLFNADEARMLKSYGELGPEFEKDESIFSISQAKDDDDVKVQFGVEDDSSDDSDDDSRGGKSDIDIDAI
jgi:translation initiation factor 1A